MVHERKSNENKYFDLQIAKSFHIIHRDIVCPGIPKNCGPNGKELTMIISNHVI